MATKTETVAASDVDTIFPALTAESAKVPRPKGPALSYGTAGFRMEAKDMRSTAFRMGLLATLRSRSFDPPRAIGLCLTASHNPEKDNGIKLADPDGSVLDHSWEKWATLLANAESVSEAVAQIVSSSSTLASSFSTCKGTGAVFLARDTRSSGTELARLAREACLLLRGNVVDYGILTTPQLHHMVRAWNADRREEATERGYFRRLVGGYLELLETAPSASVSPLVLDGAFGVGATKIDPLNAALSSSKGGKERLRIELRNGYGKGPLNEGAGADHVYRKRVPPKNVDSVKDKHRRCASFDGDADRVVYHFYDGDGRWHLLDGDKIATLFAEFLREQLDKLEGGDAMTLAVVQNSYANGASTKYLRSKNVAVEFGKTGVKHLHHKAAQYDVGVYFEANGHGTVLFSKRFDEITGNAGKSPAARRLRAARRLLNQAVGDAFSDMMFVEAILAIRGWTVEKWNAEGYSNLPSRQTKVVVPDRTKVMPDDTERRVTAPAGLQEAIDAAIAETKDEVARAFVRPSGTEDIVRVYAEATTEDAANALAKRVSDAVTRFAG